MTRRSRATSRRDPVRTAAVLLPALVAAALIPVLVRAAYRTVTSSTQGRVEPPAPRVARLPDTPAHLLVAADDQGRPVIATLLAPSPTGAGGAVVVVPLGTQTPGAAGALRRLDTEAGGRGLEGLAADVEGVLGITLTFRVQVTAGGLAALLAPLVPVTVRLPDDVRSVRPDGTDALVLPAGERAVGAADLAAVLIARGDEGELSRVERAAELWRALLPTVARPAVAGSSATTSAASALGPVPSSVGGAAGSLDGVLRTLVAGRTVVRTLPVSSAGGTGDDERFAPDLAGVRLLMAEIVPAAVSPANANVRLRILNPSADQAVAYQAVARLTAAGANVVLADETPGAVPASSALTFGDQGRRAELAGLVPVIGALTLASTEERIDGIDGTISLGQDFVALARKAAAASTTVAPTTTLSPTTTAIPAAASSTTSIARSKTPTTKKTP